MELIEKATEKVAEKVDSPSPSAFLLGAQAAVVGVFTALQVTGDVFSRMVANHPVWTALAIGFASLATAFALVALILGSWIRNWFLVIGVASFLLGAACATVAATLVSSDRPKPSVTITKLEGQRRIEASVKLNNLKTRETIFVRVEPLRTTPLPGGGLQYEPIRDLPTIYEAGFGPNAEGNVDRVIVVDLPPAGFSYIGIRAWVGRSDDCYDETSKTTSCETRALVRRSERPQLSAVWKGSTAKPKLAVKVTARDLAPDASIYLRVRGNGRGGGDLASWTLAPDLGGSLQRTLSVEVSRRLSSICVEASTSKAPSGTCRAMSDKATAWVKLKTPAASPRRR
jgi:hypothetical protein